MELVKFIKDEKLTVELNGRVDSSNSAIIQEEIDKVISEVNCTGVIVDAENLEYISSAGLRVVLSIKKKIDDFTMINVSRDVYDILEMTGFVSLFEVKRALRKMSVDNLEMIGQGTCGKVYRIDADTIVKVFHPGFDIKKIKSERENAQNAFLNGIETAISFDIVQVGDQIGVVYEMLDADTFRNCMRRNPDKIEFYIGIYADFLKTMHNIHFEQGALQEIKPKWVGSIDYLKVFSDEEKEAVKEMFAAVPARDTFIHGDYNIGNIMYQNGKPILIDMADASVGHPIFDLAGVLLGFKLFPMLIPEEYCEQMTGFNKADNVIMWNKFCEVYFDAKTEEERIEIERQITPFAAFRVVQASLAVAAFPEAMIHHCKNIVVNALKGGNHLLSF